MNEQPKDELAEFIQNLKTDIDELDSVAPLPIHHDYVEGISSVHKRKFAFFSAAEFLCQRGRTNEDPYQRLDGDRFSRSVSLIDADGKDVMVNYIGGMVDGFPCAENLMGRLVRPPNYKSYRLIGELSNGQLRRYET